ncbi:MULTISPECIES: hypothetical protein [unclassified Halomonas]|nr:MULTISPECIES: hypothetical protein [unclassified Halomonas]
MTATPSPELTRLTLGFIPLLDGAHMLAPLPLAMSLGWGERPARSWRPSP